MRDDKKTWKSSFSIVGCSICTIVGSQTKKRKTFLKIYYNSMPGKVYLITNKNQNCNLFPRTKKLRKIQKIVMVAVISKRKQANGSISWAPFAANKTGKLNTFGSGKNIKSTTGLVRPGMSLSRVAVACRKRCFSSVLSLVYTLVFGSLYW